MSSPNTVLSVGLEQWLRWATKPEHEEGAGRHQRKTEGTLESDLTLAQHVLGLPTPSVAQAMDRREQLHFPPRGTLLADK